MSVLAVQNLCKKYEHFYLDQVSFTMEQGKIMGFIGRNGSGKTTTLKALLNLVHPDAGEIRFFGQSFSENEWEIKQKIGFVSGGIDYYPKKKLRTITEVTRRFYPNWNSRAYQSYLERFQLLETKTPDQLSAGMRVKYALALALSHHAELLLLDEPTSGLDPVSREDLLDVFLALAEEGISILFSTHITSDLDKCADTITYIKNGKIEANTDLDAFIQQYKVVEWGEEALPHGLEGKLIGCKKSKRGHTALIRSEDAAQCALPCVEANLEAILVHLERE